MLESWTRELRQAARALRRTPGFTLLAVLTLGLAIGANAVIFTVVETVLLDPLPFAANDRLVTIAGTAPGSDLPPQFPLSIEFFLHYRERSKLVEDLSTFNSFTNTLRVGDRIERIRMSAPTASLFSTLGATPIRGRLPVPEDEGRVMVLSYDLWQTWFGGAEDVLGRSFYAGGEERTVIGIMGPDFWFPSDQTLLWFPNPLKLEDVQPGRFGQPLVARLVPGTRLDDLRTELADLARELPQRFGGSPAYARIVEQFRPVVEPLDEALYGSVAGPLWILFAATGIVWLIACANVGHLFLVRAERRRSDLAVRRALGAGRLRLVTSQLAEATVVAGLAGLVAAGLARIGVPLLVAAAPSYVSRLSAARLDGATLLFTVAACLVSALASIALPALRFSAPRLDSLRTGDRGATRGRSWGRQALVAAETALALVLLIGSALLLRSFERLRDVDPGYRTDDLFTFQIAPEQEGLDGALDFARFHLAFRDRLAALPGVESVGIVENVPLDEGLSGARVHTESTPAGDAGSLVSFTYTAGPYFETMGIPLVAGRPFELGDHLENPGHVLVSRSAAELLWPGQEAVGRRLRLGDDEEPWQTVVGVVGDVRQDDYRQPPDPMVYLPLVGPDPATSRVVSSPGYVVRTARAESIAPEIRELVRQVAPSAPMYRTYTMAFLAERSRVQLAFTLLTLGLAAGLALVLGIVGLYGVLSYAVALRTREIGVRMALGAEARKVRGMVVAQGARLLAAGVVLGVASAALATRSLAGLLFGVGSLDVVTYLALSTLMIVVGLAACYLPARRASRVDPMTALRVE